MMEINDDYDFLNEIGRGGYSEVYLAQDVQDSKKYAIKSIEKSKIFESSENYNQIINEIRFLRVLDHPGIVKLHKVYESETHVYLVMDYLMGGSFVRRLRNKNFYSEFLAAKVIHKLLSILKYLNSMNIVHRDIKLENLMLTSVSNDIDFKLIDFGLASEISKNLTLKCGSPGYVAPEVFNNKPYNSQVDIFSAGIVLYHLLLGRGPFSGCFENPKFSITKEVKITFEEKL